MCAKVEGTTTDGGLYSGIWQVVPVCTYTQRLALLQDISAVLKGCSDWLYPHRLLTCCSL